MAYDVKKIRENFPVLSQSVNGKPLVYLDNTATTQKPREVIGRMTEFFVDHRPIKGRMDKIGRLAMVARRCDGNVFDSAVSAPRDGDAFP